MVTKREVFTLERDSEKGMKPTPPMRHTVSAEPLDVPLHTFLWMFIQLYQDILRYSLGLRNGRTNARSVLSPDPIEEMVRRICARLASDTAPSLSPSTNRCRRPLSSAPHAPIIAAASSQLGFTTAKSPMKVWETDGRTKAPKANTRRANADWR